MMHQHQLMQWACVHTFFTYTAYQHRYLPPPPPKHTHTHTHTHITCTHSMPFHRPLLSRDSRVKGKPAASALYRGRRQPLCARPPPTPLLSHCGDTITITLRVIYQLQAQLRDLVDQGVALARAHAPGAPALSASICRWRDSAKRACSSARARASCKVASWCD